jgi:hypothetical protein
MSSTRMIVFAAIAASVAALGSASADENGDRAVCNDQCTNDSNGNFESCHRMCMSQQQLYDTAPNEPTRSLPPVPVLYGAIAVETSTLITGYAKDYSSRVGAERRAVAMCRRAGGSATGCKIAVWGHNSCLALATSKASNGGANTWGYAWSDDGYVSRREATAACRKDGGANCKIAVTFCTG